MTSQPPDAPPSKRKTARELTELLGETNGRAYEQMRRLLAKFDRDFVMGIYRQAVEVEASGGLLFEVKGGELKRRSLGGVFFWLAKQAMGPELTDQIIPSRGVRIARGIQRQAERKAARKAAAALAPPVEIVPVEVAPALPLPKPITPKPKAVPPPKAAKPIAATPAKPVARPANPEASRAHVKRRGPVKMPEVFHTLRTK